MITTTLASFPSPSQGVWHLGPIPIRAYALCIIIGIVVALLIGDRRWAARGGERGVIYDIALWAVPFGLIGGRLYHVLTDWTTYFGPGGAGPLAALRVWDGGLGIWGAVALGGVGAWIGCRRRGIPLPAFGDAIAPGIVLAQAIGRVGNYFNQELYGRETTVPWGMEIFYRRDPSGIVDVHSLNGISTGQVAATVHPTFLYELLWNLLVFVILILVDRRLKFGHGRLFALYVALYCVGRFGVELLRDDTATHIAGIRINSFTATFVFLGAVVYIILAKKGREDPRTLGGCEEFDDAKVPELARELAAVASGTGVVAAATVAGREDFESESDEVAKVADELEAVDEFEPLDESDEVDESAPVEPAVEVEVEPEAVDEFEPLDESDEVDESATVEPTVEAEAEPGAVDESDTAEPEVLAADSLVESSVDVESAEPQTAPASDADDVESEPEDESVIEAETVSTGVSVETAADAEDDLIDEDHDPIGEEELEGLSDGYAPSAPLSEQEESLETTDDDGELVTEEAEVVSEPAPVESSEMIVVYASEPVSDEIVYVQSEDAEEDDGPTAVYAEAGEDSSTDVTVIYGDAEATAAETVEADEAEPADVVAVETVEPDEAEPADVAVETVDTDEAEPADVAVETVDTDEAEPADVVAVETVEPDEAEPADVVAVETVDTDEAGTGAAEEVSDVTDADEPEAVATPVEGPARGGDTERGSRLGRVFRRRR